MPVPAQPPQEQLAAAVELNHAEMVRLHGALPWVDSHEEADVVWAFAGDTWPRNAVAYARFDAANAHRRVGEILASHLRHKAACNWVVGPLSQPADLSQHLREHGFRCTIHCPGMACDLNKLPPSPIAPRGVTIAQTDQPPPMLPLTTARRRRRHEGRLFLGQLQPRRVWHFTALTKSKAVGETVLVAGAGVAGLYGVEVLVKYRGRGIGTALVRAALAQAKALGFSTAVLSASGLGKGVYERVGFREVCKLSFWKYGKMRQL